MKIWYSSAFISKYWVINVKNSRNVFQMQISTQTDNRNLTKNVTNNKKCILRKIGLKFQNPKFYAIFCYKIWTLRMMSFWNDWSSWRRLCASISWETEIHSRNSTWSIYFKIYFISFVYHHHLQKHFLQLEHLIQIELVGHLYDQ